MDECDNEEANGLDKDESEIEDTRYISNLFIPPSSLTQNESKCLSDLDRETRSLNHLVCIPKSITQRSINYAMDSQGKESSKAKKKSIPAVYKKRQNLTRLLQLPQLPAPAISASWLENAWNLIFPPRTASVWKPNLASNSDKFPDFIQLPLCSASSEMALICWMLYSHLTNCLLQATLYSVNINVAQSLKTLYLLLAVYANILKRLQFIMF